MLISGSRSVRRLVTDTNPIRNTIRTETSTVNGFFTLYFSMSLPFLTDDPAPRYRSGAGQTGCMPAGAANASALGMDLHRIGPRSKGPGAPRVLHPPYIRKTRRPHSLLQSCLDFVFSSFWTRAVLFNYTRTGRTCKSQNVIFLRAFPKFSPRPGLLAGFTDGKLQKNVIYCEDDGRTGPSHAEGALPPASQKAAPSEKRGHAGGKTPAIPAQSPALRQARASGQGRFDRLIQQ